jgi:hypothetical protein
VLLNNYQIESIFIMSSERECNNAKTPPKKKTKKAYLCVYLKKWEEQ